MLTMENNRKEAPTFEFISRALLLRTREGSVDEIAVLAETFEVAGLAAG